MAYVELPETGFTVERLLGNEAVSEVGDVSAFYRAWRNLRFEPLQTLVFFERNPLKYGFGVFYACLNMKFRMFEKAECLLFNVPLLGSSWPTWRSAEDYAYDRAKKLRMAPMVKIPQAIEDLFI